MANPFIPVPNTVRAELGGTIGSVPWAHILNWNYTGTPPSQTALQAGTTILGNQFTTHLGPLMAGAVTITFAKLTDIASATGAQAESTFQNSGTLVGQANAANVAFVITKIIGRRYKGGHPKASLPLGVQTSLANANTWTPSFVTSVFNAYTAFISACGGGAMWPGVGGEVTVHRKLNHITLTSPFTDIVQSYKADPMIGSQRRRIGR